MGSQIEKQLVEILKENIPSLQGDMEQILASDLRSLQINSLNFIKIIVTIEDAFEIEFEDSQFNQEFFGKVSNLVKIIEQKISRQEASGK